jgi:hypothetical protein
MQKWKVNENYGMNLICKYLDKTFKKQHNMRNISKQSENIQNTHSPANIVLNLE